ELGHTPGIAHALINVADVVVVQGDYALARSQYEESLKWSRELGNKRGIAIALNGLGNVASSQGDYSAARAHYEESLAIRSGLEGPRLIPFPLEGLAALAARTGDIERAARLWGASQRQREEISAPLPPAELAEKEQRVIEACAAMNNDDAFHAA